ncbi:hypothetical protein S40285_09906 [Stachybotrys chlorohalonatus IBT 40285]|uniref:Uncharacterized protein n=1 Tax=Stachybotrys chlorohalonatus (strain IBT 40285) TaxID=1283841 RepID=A0A084QMT2_STAC4|nr:hypothetical protein S40285_09906 [Stachybotrys chlorohalonata IBT 40285]
MRKKVKPDKSRGMAIAESSLNGASKEDGAQVLQASSGFAEGPQCPILPRQEQWNTSGNVDLGRVGGGKIPEGVARWHKEGSGWSRDDQNGNTAKSGGGSYRL